MSSLHEFKCVACRGDVPALTAGEIENYLPEVPDWKLIEIDGIPHLQRTLRFKNFAEALAFTQQVGAAAEEEDHHPTILTEWGKVTVTWWTHKIHGLHKNDFIMAAKTDQLYHR